VGPRTGLDDVEKRKFLILPGVELRPLGLPAHSQLYDVVLQIPALSMFCETRPIVSLKLDPDIKTSRHQIA
jgi:hypothetical protein